MKALSIREPWLERILRGLKREEFRSRQIGYRGPILLVSSRRLDDAPIEAWEDLGPDGAAVGRLLAHRRPRRVEALRRWPYELGHARGLVRITGCRRTTWRGQAVYGWRLADVHRIEHPFPATGQLGLFDVDLDAAAGIKPAREIAGWLASLRYPQPEARP